MTNELRYKQKTYRLTKRYSHIVKNMKSGADHRSKYEYKLVRR